MAGGDWEILPVGSDFGQDCSVSGFDASDATYSDRTASPGHLRCSSSYDDTLKVATIYKFTV